MKDECDISKNVDDSKLDNPIKLAQEQLKYLIGDDFYDQIDSQATAFSGAADNLAFFDPYVKQFLAWQAYEYYIPKANFAETRSGFRIHREDNSDIATDKQMGELIRQVKQQSQFYKGKMISFLIKSQNADSTKYPLYTSNCGLETYGNGFHITAVSRRDPTSNKINKQIFNG